MIFSILKTEKNREHYLDAGMSFEMKKADGNHFRQPFHSGLYVFREQFHRPGLCLRARGLNVRFPGE